MKAGSQLFKKTDSVRQVQEVVCLDRKHEDFLRAVVEEVQERTRYQINKSSVVRTLIESVMEAGMNPEDITKIYRRERGKKSLEDTRSQISQEITEIEADLRLALIDHPTETAAVRQLRRNLRYQKQRLHAVETQMNVETDAKRP